MGTRVGIRYIVSFAIFNYWVGNTNSYVYIFILPQHTYVCKDTGILYPLMTNWANIFWNKF